MDSNSFLFLFFFANAALLRLAPRRVLGRLPEPVFNIRESPKVFVRLRSRHRGWTLVSGSISGSERVNLNPPDELLTGSVTKVTSLVA